VLNRGAGVDVKLAEELVKLDQSAINR